MQIITGFLLRFNYCRNRQFAFERVLIICQERFNGSLIRWTHLNGASLFFIIVYLHIARGLINYSFRLTKTWLRGVTILLILMITAFLGYVLPWGQMSLWGATVITNLVSAVPIVGDKIVIWLWGGFAVNSYTLSFFYSLHFIMPLLMVVIVLFHIIFLHETGSSSTLYLHTHEVKMSFNYSFVIKDMINCAVFFLFFLFIFVAPYKLGDPENFILANPLMSPLHIQPEWYFLFAYAILRAIPNKLGGVVALALRVVIFYMFPFFSVYPMDEQNKLVFWLFLSSFILLTWLGRCPVEEPYITIRQVLTFIYFICCFLFVLPVHVLFL